MSHIDQLGHVLCVLQLQEAVSVFLHHARGPACDKYIGQLKENCMRIWQDGRQMCEEISLTGNHCVNEVCPVGLLQFNVMYYSFLLYSKRKKCDLRLVLCRWVTFCCSSVEINLSHKHLAA